MLRIRGLQVAYGAASALSGIDLDVAKGEFVAVVGANGAGKSTLLKTISGLINPRAGEIRFDGTRIDAIGPERVAALGIAHVPEGRRVFPDQSTEDNLWLGAYQRLKRESRTTIARDLAAFFERFPNLAARRSSPAGLLSGGEQQMLAIARALIGKPRLLMLDEPSLGLAPTIMQSVFELLATEHSAGTTILLVEQLAYAALGASGRAYLLERGAVHMSGASRELLADDHVRKVYLG